MHIASSSFLIKTMVLQRSGVVIRVIAALLLILTNAAVDAAEEPECTFDHCPVCLPEAKNLSNLKNLDIVVDGEVRAVPFRIGRCLEFWDTQALVAQFAGILATEKLGINIEYVHAEDEVVFFMALNNCRNWQNAACKKVVRSTTEAVDAHNAGEKIFPDAAPDIMWVSEISTSFCCQESNFAATDIVWLAKETRSFAPVGFVSLNGMYIYPEIAEKAWKQERLTMTQYWAYREETVPVSKKYFSTVQEILDSGSVVHENPGCTGQSEAASDGIQRLLGWNFTCIDGWWLTPACAAFGADWTQECIPVLDDGWGYFKPNMYQTMAEEGMRFAKVTLGYDLFWEFVYYKYFNAPFLWWSTDSQFTALGPLKVQMSEAFNTGQYVIMSQEGWQPLLEPNKRLTYLLRNIRMSNKEADSLMKDVADAQDLGYWSGQEGGPALYQKLACDWLRKNREVWESAWLPDPRSCSQGDFYDETLSICQPCPAGTYSYRDPLDGIPRCLLCPAGSFCPDRSPAPVRCIVGHFAADRGSGSCDACSKGRYQNETGQSECIRCNELMTTLPDSNRVSVDDCACDLGTFIVGTSCEACPANSTTLALASESPSSCLCAEGTYMSADYNFCIPCPLGSETKGSGKIEISSCLCEKGTYLPPGASSCSECPEGFECPRGSSAANFADTVPQSLELNFPLLKTGYWTYSDKPLEVYMCESSASSRCSGGPAESCAGGHIGFLCAKCNDGYLSTGTKCIKCSWLEDMGPLLIVILLIGVSIGVYYLANDKQTASASPRLLGSVVAGMIITVGQVVGTFNQLNLPWPGSVNGICDAMSVLVFKPDTIAAECMFGYDPALLFAARFSVPFLVVACFLGLFMLSKITSMVMPGTVWTFDKTLNSIGVLFQTVFIALNGFVAVPLQCYSHPNGLKSVAQFSSVICGTDEQVPLLVMSCVTLLVFVIPFFGISVWAAVKVAGVAVGDNRLCIRFRYLLYRFRPDVWWWGLAFTMRQLMLAFAPTIRPDDPVAQIMYVVFVLSSYLAILCYFWPWKAHGLNIFDAVSTIVLLLVVVVMSSFMPPSKWPSNYNDILLMLFVGLMVLGAVFLSWVILLFAFVSHGQSCRFIPWREPAEEFAIDLRRFGRFLDSLAAEDTQALLSTMNLYDRRKLKDAIGALQASVGSQAQIASRTPSRLYDVTASKGIVEAAKLMDTETSAEARRLSADKGLLQAAQEQLKVRSNSNLCQLESPTLETQPKPSLTYDEEMTNSVSELLCLPETRRGALPRYSPFFHTSHDAVQSTTTCTSSVTVPRVPIPVRSMTPPGIRSLAMTPPGVRPPAMTPPGMTPPAMTPPGTRPPAMTPPLMSPAGTSAHKPAFRSQAAR